MAKMRPEDYTMFTKSKPWGYHPILVEQQIAEYDKAINAITEKYLNARNTCLKLGERIEQLENELRDMHIQMSSLELPETSEVVEHYVLDDFKNYNSTNADDSIPSPSIVSNGKKKPGIKKKTTNNSNNINGMKSKTNKVNNNNKNLNIITAGNDNSGDDEDDGSFIIIQ